MNVITLPGNVSQKFTCGDFFLAPVSPLGYEKVIGFRNTGIAGAGGDVLACAPDGKVGIIHLDLQPLQQLVEGWHDTTPVQAVMPTLAVVVGSMLHPVRQPRLRVESP